VRLKEGKNCIATLFVEFRGIELQYTIKLLAKKRIKATFTETRSKILNFQPLIMSKTDVSLTKKVVNKLSNFLVIERRQVFKKANFVKP
jgi:hypothetical protein